MKIDIYSYALHQKTLNQQAYRTIIEQLIDQCVIHKGSEYYTMDGQLVKSSMKCSQIASKGKLGPESSLVGIPVG